MTIRTFLDVSTMHISHDATLWLEENSFELGILSGETGFMIWALADFRAMPSIQKVLDHARTLGVDYVMLDADAPVVDGLPIHEW